ncbi:hypothetical protein CN923_13625 [Bacillus cereus]|nr:hypothetical protein CON44_28930 [Bacillus cereus]PFK23226.1 hypothetical protein COJ05_15235 [Bacillus cereus]PFP55402.1 hypothetical protein COK09_21105 [Bacillus cereus]PFV12101.1 hypothetical protein COK97_26955 [Bacillus cereus]PGK85483.1 hypothetical protein CN924_03735 [Bacillus cereus]
MKIILDNVEYSSKPSGREIGLINNRIIRCNAIEIDAAKLAEEVTKGKTFIPATFKFIGDSIKRSKANWESQQVIALDFDEDLTLDEAINDIFFKQHAAFLYTTFRHKDSHHKFRVVFVLDKPLTQYKDFEHIMDSLLERFPQADRACRDGSRLFFGGKEAIPYDFNNSLKIASFAGLNTTPLTDIQSNLNMSVTRVHTNPEASHSVVYTNHVELIRNRNIKKLQELLHIKPVTLSTNEVLDYLKKEDLRTFLGIRTEGNFIDIFHGEDNPSASIYQSGKGNGHWLYKCHSTSNPFTGTVLHVVQRLLECSVVEAKKFLMELYSIEIYESEAVKEFKESIDMYKELLRSEELEEIHPHFYKVFSKYGHLLDLYMLLDLAKEFITNDTDPRIVFYHSIRTLAQQFGRSASATGTRMNFFTLFKVTRKLDESELPEKLLKIQKRNKREKHFQYMSNTYELPMYTYEFFRQIDEMCRVWLDKGCTGRTISYEGIMRTFGRDEADRVFPQDKGKEIAELNEELVSKIQFNTLKLVQSKGWATEKEILDMVKLYFKGQQEFKTKQFKRCIAEMVDAYELEIIPSNKEIKKEMGITEEDMSKASFPKIIRKKLVKDCRPLQVQENIKLIS